MSHRTFDDPHGTSDRARQGLLDNRTEHTPKNHRTLGRRKRMSKEKRSRVKHHLEENKVWYRQYLSKVRRYWRGEEENHP